MSESEFGVLTHSLNPIRVSRTATVRKGHGKRTRSSIIMVLNKIAQKLVHGTTIVPHDGQQSSMMNEKHVQKKPGVDHPIASVDDLGAHKVAHGNFLHKNNQVAILNKELANDSLYMRSWPQNGICPSESSQAMISLDKFDTRSAFFDTFLTSHHASHHWQQEPNQQLNVAFSSSRCRIWKAQLLTKGLLSNQTKWQGKWLSQKTGVAISRTHGNWVVFPCADWISSTQCQFYVSHWPLPSCSNLQEVFSLDIYVFPDRVPFQSYRHQHPGTYGLSKPWWSKFLFSMYSDVVPQSESESESEVRMPKRQPCFRARTGTKCSKFWTISEKQARLLCTKFHELIHLHYPVVHIRSHVLPIIPTFYNRENCSNLLVQFIPLLHTTLNGEGFPIHIPCAIARQCRQKLQIWARHTLWLWSTKQWWIFNAVKCFLQALACKPNRKHAEKAAHFRARTRTKSRKI